MANRRLARDMRGWSLGLCVCGVLASLLNAESAAQQASAPRAVLDTYCVACHNQKLRTAGLSLDVLDVTKPADNADRWERVVAKLRAGSMPPAGRPRPDAATY